ncbi:MAG: hypothetical protein AAFO77_07575, partial [Pseudomonadota bacterium]
LWSCADRRGGPCGWCMTKEINLLGALHSARRGLELGLFNRVVGNNQLGAATDELVELLRLKNQQGLRQLKFIINKNVEADLHTAQGFEAVQAGFTSAVLMNNLVADSDGIHGWLAYAKGDADSPIKERREKSISFWTD